MTQDEAYDLVQDAPLSSDEQAMNTLLAKLIREPLGGKIDTLLGGEKAALVAAGVGMAEQQASSVSIRVLWSGGAGNCVIVGAVSGGKAWITHADRTGPSPDRIVKEVGKIGKGAQVFLASQIFRSPNAGSSQLVRSIVESRCRGRRGSDHHSRLRGDGAWPSTRTQTGRCWRAPSSSRTWRS